VDHAGQPVEGGVGVGAADALDEGADGVEVGVALLVVEDGALLDGVLGDGEGEVGGAVGAGGVVSTANSRALSRARASPLAVETRWVRASSSMRTRRAP
jgi:hypothetical protein